VRLAIRQYCRNDFLGHRQLIYKSPKFVEEGLRRAIRRLGNRSIWHFRWFGLRRCWHCRLPNTACRDAILYNKPDGVGKNGFRCPPTWPGGRFRPPLVKFGDLAIQAECMLATAAMCPTTDYIRWGLIGSATRRRVHLASRAAPASV